VDEEMLDQLGTSSAPAREYLRAIVDILDRIEVEEVDAIGRAAELMVDQIASDKLVWIFGPGGHSNLAAQELFSGQEA
jgi:uncharacterized phosphosugar-binding protein